MRGEVSPISATSPPTPDDERWGADYPSSNGAVSKVRSDSVRRLVVLAYITAVSMPPIGVVLAIVVAVRSAKMNSKHWLWIIAVSIIASVVWILIITSGALSTASTDY